MDERSRRVARARLLRRDGKTYDEIRAVIGPVDDTTLRTWLRDIPRPPSTNRSHPKTELRRACRRLRAQGLTYSEIAEATGASAGSISPWVRDIPVRDSGRGERRRLDALRTAARSKAAVARRRRELEARIASSEIGPLTDRELFLLGVGLYWAEGTKSKPYAVRERVTFINSDPEMVQVFIRWLQLVGVRQEDCRFRVHIHETADVAAAEQYWADVAGVPREALSRTTLKRHRPRTNRLNVTADYRGCFVVTVLLSAQLYRRIAAWWEGLAGQVLQRPTRSTAWGEVAPWQRERSSRRRLEPAVPGCSVGRGDETLNLGTT